MPGLRQQLGDARAQGVVVDGLYPAVLHDPENVVGLTALGDGDDGGGLRVGEQQCWGVGGDVWEPRHDNRRRGNGLGQRCVTPREAAIEGVQLGLGQQRAPREVRSQSELGLEFRVRFAQAGALRFHEVSVSRQ